MVEQDSQNIQDDISRIDNNSSLSRNLTGSSEHLIPKPAPNDRYKRIWISFAILGVTTLVPWNFFITATDYWMHKFRNVTNEVQLERTPLQTFFESYLAIAANFPMLIAMFLTTLYGQRIALKYRLNLPLFVVLIVFILTTMFAVLDTDKIQMLFFSLTIVMVILVSFFSAVFQAALFGYTANFPQSCMHAVVIGQGLSGLLASLLRILTLITRTGPTTSGILYFLSSTVFVIFAIAVFWSMDTEFTRYYLDPRHNAGPSSSPEESQQQMPARLGASPDLVKVIKTCWPMALTVFMTFTSTLSVFPAISVLILPEVPSKDYALLGDLYTPVVTFVLFNFADLAGRLCSNYLPFPVGRPKFLLSLGAVRILFPILILFCNVVKPNKHLPILFVNDIYYPIFISLASLTNGYLFSSAMILASSGAEQCHREITGFVMTFSLGLGLFSGSIISTLLLRII